MIETTYEITFTRTNAGVLRIDDTRVSLDSVVIAFEQGATPEQIVQDYDSLTLGQVYATIAYYLHNRAEVDSYLIARSERRADLRSQHDQAGIRERLLARRREAA